MSEMKKFTGLYAYGLRDVAGHDIKIEKVWPTPYRRIYNETTKKTTDFHQFPIDERQVIPSGDESTRARKDEPKKEWRRKVYNESSNRFEFHKYELPEDFFKVSSKTFDIEVSFAKPTMLNKGKKLNVGEYSSARIPVSASKIRELLQTYTNAPDNIPQKPGKNKKGEPCMFMPFDWEDSLVGAIEGLFLNIKVTGTTKEDTTYYLRPGKPFTSIKEAEEVFGAEAPKADKPYKPHPGEPTKAECESVPF